MMMTMRCGNWPRSSLISLRICCKSVASASAYCLVISDAEAAASCAILAYSPTNGISDTGFKTVESFPNSPEAFFTGLSFSTRLTAEPNCCRNAWRSRSCPENHHGLKCKTNGLSFFGCLPVPKPGGSDAALARPPRTTKPDHEQYPDPEGQDRGRERTGEAGTPRRSSFGSLMGVSASREGCRCLFCRDALFFGVDD